MFCCGTDRGFIYTTVQHLKLRLAPSLWNDWCNDQRPCFAVVQIRAYVQHLKLRLAPSLWNSKCNHYKPCFVVVQIGAWPSFLVSGKTSVVTRGHI